MPKVTVCIAVFNGSETLASSIESVLAQTYTDFEVLVLDDGSTDGSADIAAKYPVRLIRQENRGLGAARRRMVEEAKGELVGFNDHDDVWMPDKLERQVPAHDDPSVVLSYTGGAWMRLDGSVVIRDDTAPEGSCSFDHLLPVNHIIGISALFRRDAMLAAGNFAEDVRVGSDVYGWFLLAGRGKFVYVPGALVRYFERPGQNTAPSYRFFEHDRRLYEDHLMARFDELFANAPVTKRALYRRYLRRNIGRIQRALAHYARVERGDYRLALRHHWRSVSSDPFRFDYWASLVKNALFWREGASGNP